MSPAITCVTPPVVEVIPPATLDLVLEANSKKSTVPPAEEHIIALDELISAIPAGEAKQVALAVSAKVLRLNLLTLLLAESSKRASFVASTVHPPLIVGEEVIVVAVW